MEMYGTTTASLRAAAGAARSGAVCYLATGHGHCAHARTWQISQSTKAANPVFGTDDPARRPWELST
jgi:hypothetical protein